MIILRKKKKFRESRRNTNASRSTTSDPSTTSISQNNFIPIRPEFDNFLRDHLDVYHGAIDPSNELNGFHYERDMELKENFTEEHVIYNVYCAICKEVHHAHVRILANGKRQAYLESVRRHLNNKHKVPYGERLYKHIAVCRLYSVY
jgi:hypothetical protein